MKALLLIILSLSFGLATVIVAQQAKTEANSQSKPITSLKVTGHYSARSKTAPNSMEVQQLPGGKIKFHILALWVSSYNRENVHNGEVQGVVDLVGDTATFEEEHCKITIKFTSRAAIVKHADERGDCEFGANVSATGTYRKTDSRKPKFDY